MERTLALKLAAIGVLIVVLMFALSSIGRLVSERQARRDGVIQDIARSSSEEQQLTGPILIVPYVKTLREWRENDRGERRMEEREVTGQLHFLPEHFQLEGDVRTELRTRGIYVARFYHAKLKMGAAFDLPLHYGVNADLAAYQFGPPFIAVGVTDIRGIESPLTAPLDGVSLKLLPGTGTELIQAGIHAPVTSNAGESPTHLKLSIDLPLLGTSALHVLPVGRETQVDLNSNWPNPSFTGDLLPAQRTVNSGGFSAHWATSFFATNLEESLRRCEGHARLSCEEFAAHRLGVNFVDPVDQYLEADRATKYALLFIVLTFAGFFLFDVLKRLPVHPIQYGLVGAALSLFYLLLLSLSEHVGFAMAYLLSAGACVALITFYVSYVLRGIARGLSFGGALAALYGCLFGLLSADDYALLMGSLLVFALLAAVMILTRHVSWSNLGSRPESR